MGAWSAQRPFRTICLRCFLPTLKVESAKSIQNVPIRGGMHKSEFNKWITPLVIPLRDLAEAPRADQGSRTRSGAFPSALWKKRQQEIRRSASPLQWQWGWKHYGQVSLFLRCSGPILLPGSIRLMSCLWFCSCLSSDHRTWLSLSLSLNSLSQSSSPKPLSSSFGILRT